MPLRLATRAGGEEGQGVGQVPRRFAPQPRQRAEQRAGAPGGHGRHPRPHPRAHGPAGAAGPPAAAAAGGSEGCGCPSRRPAGSGLCNMPVA